MRFKYQSKKIGKKTSNHRLAMASMLPSLKENESAAAGRKKMRKIALLLLRAELGVLNTAT